MPSVFVISLLKIKPYLVTQNIYSVGGICHLRHVYFLGETSSIAGCFVGFGDLGAPEGSTGRLIFGDTFAACSNLSSSFVNCKVSGNVNSCRLLRYCANAHRLDRLGNNVRREIHCLEATYVKDFFIKLSYFSTKFLVAYPANKIYMSLCMRKQIIWVSDHDRHKPGCIATA